ncbi:DUF2062 domain-containing protein [Effusibacillus lacus]|uniref:Group-specific protein n=1 Tax=Effusibacillus lacus TaxID=1348429 RepID=A0A292YTD4_9BACL|nr:DUF2062 domain-containing protein [Effusibacillus lacus]TCS75869.1 uncharacterized protein (DUF2062 family) [Effusibacillus lacus]GAX91740.1 group-specific protein [Effusibacillus lacus]
MAKLKTEGLKRFGRAIKYQYVKLLRSPEGARKVALGFAIGFGIEFLVISTMGVIYPIFILLVWITRSSVTSAAIGHVIAKLTFLPIPLLIVGKWLGGLLLPFAVRMPDWMPDWLDGFLELQLKTILGMTLISIALGALSYPVAYCLYEANRKRRDEKLSKKLAQAQNNCN